MIALLCQLRTRGKAGAFFAANLRFSEATPIEWSLTIFPRKDRAPERLANYTRKSARLYTLVVTPH